MKKQIKILLLSAVIAVALLLITSTNVKAETFDVPVSYGDFSADGITTVSFTLPEAITGVDRLTENGWIVDENTATKQMERGSTYYYEQTNIEGDVYKATIAVAMQSRVGSTIILSDSFTNVTIDNTDIATIDGTRITATAPGSTKVRANKSTTSGTVINFVWDYTVVGDTIPPYYYLMNWEFNFKESLSLNVGDKQNLDLNAALAEGITPSTSEIPFNVEFTAEDGSVISITDTNSYGITNSGKIGSAKIEALKAGTTKINVKVTLNNSDWSTIIPVTVTATPSEDGSNESGTDTDGNKEEGKTTPTDNNAGNKGNSNGKNGTEATENISQAGSNAAIVLFVIAGFGIVAVISKKKLTKNRF